jgi:Sugar (and other) transporter.
LINWGLGEIIFVILAYFIQDVEKELLYVVGIPAFVAFLFFLFIRESPRFLYATNKLDKCEKVLLGIAKENGRAELTTGLIAATETEDLSASNTQSVGEQVEETEEDYSYLVLFKNKRLRKRLIAFTLLMCYLYTTYNGILFGLTDLNGNLYLNSLIVSVAETLAYITSSTQLLY